MLADWHNQASLLGNRDELGWRQLAMHRMFPPDEGFHCRNLARRKPNNRLIMQQEFVPLDGPAQVVLQFKPLGRISRETWRKQFYPCTAIPFGAIHGSI